MTPKTAKRIALHQVRDALKTPEAWCKLKGPFVLDPDGWRGGFRLDDGSWMDAKPWDEPITYAEFRERARRSTTMLRK